MGSLFQSGSAGRSSLCCRSPYRCGLAMIMANSSAMWSARSRAHTSRAWIGCRGLGIFDGREYSQYSLIGPFFLRATKFSLRSVAHLGYRAHSREQHNRTHRPNSREHPNIRFAPIADVSPLTSCAPFTHRELSGYPRATNENGGTMAAVSCSMGAIVVTLTSSCGGA